MNFTVAYLKNNKDRLCQNPFCVHPITRGTWFGSAVLLGAIHKPTRYSLCVRCAEMIEMVCDEGGKCEGDSFESLLTDAYWLEQREIDGGMRCCG
jgi:hypothetical protein